MAIKVGKLEVDIGVNSTAIGKGFDKINKKLKQNSDRLKRNGSQWEKWNAKVRISTFAQGLVAIGTAKKMIEYSDTFTNIQNQLRRTTKNSQELADITKKIGDLAVESRGNFKETANLYSQLQLNTTSLNLSQNELLDLTSSINKSFAISGKTSGEAANGIRQLNQALAAGVLRGDEFNSIAENAPEIQRAIAKSLGMTKGALREFAAEGGITAEIVVKAMKEAKQSIDLAFGKSVKTFGQTMEEANRNAVVFFGTSQTIKKAVKSTGESIVFLSENLGEIGSIIKLIGSVYLIKMTKSFAVNSAAIAYNAARLRILTAAQAISATTGRGLTVSLRGMSVAARVAAVSAGALKGALAFLGGATGVAILAALAIFEFSSSAGDAIEPTEDLKKKIDQLSESFKKLSPEQLSMQMANSAETTKRLSGEIAKLQKEYDFMVEKADNAGRAGAVYRNEALALKEHLDAKTALLKESEERDLALFQQGMEKKKNWIDNNRKEELGKTQEFEDDKEAKADDAWWRRFAKIQEQAEIEKQKKIELAQEDQDALELSTATALEKEQAAFDEKIARLNENAAILNMTQSEINDVKFNLEEQHKKKMKGITLTENASKRAIFARDANAIIGAIKDFGFKSLKLQKVLALAKAGVAISTGIALANDLGFPANIAEIARVVGTGARAIQGIKSAKAPSGGAGRTTPPSSAPSSVGASSGGGNSTSRNIQINMTGSGLFSADQVTQLIGQINDQIDDGVVLSVGG